MVNALNAKNQRKNVLVENNDNSFRASPEDIQRFLSIIKQLETSNGKNLNHPEVTHGVGKGDAAQGVYGMMPKTMDELDRRYPSSFGNESTPDDYAKKLGEYVLNRAHGDETVAAGLWNGGHNANIESKVPLKVPTIGDSKYAQDYENIRSKTPYSLDPNPYIEKNIQKDLDEDEANPENLGKNIRFPNINKQVGLKKP